MFCQHQLAKVTIWSCAYLEALCYKTDTLAFSVLAYMATKLTNQHKTGGNSVSGLVRSDSREGGGVLANYYKRSHRKKGGLLPGILPEQKKTKNMAHPHCTGRCGYSCHATLQLCSKRTRVLVTLLSDSHLLLGRVDGAQSKSPLRATFNCQPRNVAFEEVVPLPNTPGFRPPMVSFCSV